MKNIQNNLIETLNRFKNKKCLKIYIPHGTVLFINFGNLIFSLGKKPLKQTGKILLTTDYLFFFEWQWNILSKSKVIASSRINDDKVYLHTLNQIQILKNKKLLDFDYNKISNELKLYFEGGLVLQTFNDIVKAVENNDVRKQSIFMVLTPDSIYDAMANGKIEYQPHNVEYVTDYDENKDLYEF